MIKATFNVFFREQAVPGYKFPYWVKGRSGQKSLMVAYAESLDHLKEAWPLAENIEWTHEVEYNFTPELPRPDWFKGD